MRQLQTLKTVRRGRLKAVVAGVQAMGSWGLIWKDARKGDEHTSHPFVLI